ncbi:MAG TPA: TolC family protein [Prolixibacteraceae bacterium]|nr:TolC family protein [Prolixibacteraceae bacterium]HPS11832.1 TolC family protein [Prolixibacteraceae bacterium]
MRTHFKRIILVCLMLLTGIFGFSQEQIWSLDSCLRYAVEHNISMKKANLSINRYGVLAEQAKANRLPSVSASVSQNFGWGKGIVAETGEEYGGIEGSSSSRYNLNSSVSLFNGFKLQNSVKQTKLNLESGKYYAESVKESLELNILDAFLNVLYADEQVKNSEKQLESTAEQLALATERLALNVISKSDFLQIQSELSSEKLTLANAQSTLTMAKITLMQLMELPVTTDFAIVLPDLTNLLNQNLSPLSDEVFKMAVEFKPQIKNAELSTESARLDETIAKAGYYPSLSLSAGISSNYSSQSQNSYLDQLGNFVSPSVALSLQIPIYQKKQVKTNLAVARIGIDEASLDEQNTRNQLRKDIEQACADVSSAQVKYQASLENQKSINESYLLAEEKFKQGMINSVDFLVQKTNLITSESQLLQSKYNLVFCYKILDFYKGIPISL